MSKHILRVLLVLAVALSSTPLFATTWYVRPDGGTRYTPKRMENHLSGQCDGQADAPYPGSGTNRHCAFNDVRFLWGDGTYNNNQTWVIAGGDTVLIHGSIASGVTWRIGWSNNHASYDDATKNYWGSNGDPFGSGPPAPPSGSPGAPTRILGENYGHCHNPSDRTQWHGGFGVGSVLNMQGASYVELQCLDITDFSPCGRASQKRACNSNPGSLDDYAAAGISWSEASTHDTMTDVRVHGTAGSGMVGPTGDGTVFSYLEIIGNAAAGWNADPGNGKTGSGSLHVDHFNISWNGCAEEYPLVDKLPYTDCTDDNSGGYGDGFGTASVPSHPGWVAVFDGGVVSYNTQDGLDALHLTGEGSSMTVSHTLAYGNMGQQIKAGGPSTVVRDNVVYGNCNAMRMDLPGVPAGYNARLSDFCRAADVAILITVNDDATTVYQGNVLYTAGSTGLQVATHQSCEKPTCRITHRDNVFVGFPKDRSDGYPDGGTGEYPNPLYAEGSLMVFDHPGSVFTHNTTWHARANWSCPDKALHETDAICANPHLKDETWHVDGFGDTATTPETPTAPTPAFHTGSGTRHRGSASHAEVLLKQHPLRAAAMAVPVALLAGWTGTRLLRRPQPRI